MNSSTLLRLGRWASFPHFDYVLPCLNAALPSPLPPHRCSQPLHAYFRSVPTHVTCFLMRTSSQTPPHLPLLIVISKLVLLRIRFFLGRHRDHHIPITHSLNVVMLVVFLGSSVGVVVLVVKLGSSVGVVILGAFILGSSVGGVFLVALGPSVAWSSFRDPWRA